MKFRFHRGTLEESMQTTIEINSFDELENIIYDAFPFNKKEKITLEYACYDDRINWNTYYVCLDGKCIGMSNNNKFGE